MTKLKRIIKYGIAASILLAALLWLHPYLKSTVYPALWLLVKIAFFTLAAVFAFGLAAASIYLLRRRNVADRIDIDDPVFRDWLMDRAWFCRELGFFRQAGDNLGDTVDWIYERIQRAHGTRVGLVYTHQAYLLALDEKRVTRVDGPFHPDAAKEFIARLATISGGALKLANMKIGAVRDGVRSVEILCDNHRIAMEIGADDPRWDSAIADSLNGCLRDSGIQFAGSDSLNNGERLYTALDREGIARIRRELNW